MTKPILAYIIPVDSGGGGGPVDPGFGVPGWPSHPIAPGGSPGRPTHQIAPGGRPPGFWGGVPPEYVDIGGPGSQPHPSHPIVIIPPDSIADGVPTHPIYIPIYPSHPIVIPPGSLGGGKPEHPIYLPPGIWGGSNEPFPTHPIVIPPDAVEPGVPSHPIVIPPPPLGIWGGSNEPFPTPPIFLPPDSPEREKLIIWETGWSEKTGWVVVGVPQPPHAVPGK
jgi:hypothetical protein